MVSRQLLRAEEDFSSSSKFYLSLKEGDEVEVLEETSENWWLVRLVKRADQASAETGREGHVPSDVLSSPFSPSSSNAESAFDARHSQHEYKKEEQQGSGRSGVVNSITDVVNPKLLSRHNWVSDSANLLQKQEIVQINRTCQILFADYGVEVAVLTVSDVTDTDTTQLHRFFTDTFNYWGVGDPVRNNGLVVALCWQKRRLEMVTGVGMAQVMPDSTVQNMQQRVMVPLLRQNRFGPALEAGLLEVERYLAALPEDKKRVITATTATSSSGSGRRWHGHMYGGGRRRDSPPFSALGPSLPAVAVGFVAFVAAIVSLLIWMKDRRDRTCPACHTVSLEWRRTTLVAETCATDGAELVETVCTAKGCTYRVEPTQRVIRARCAWGWCVNGMKKCSRCGTTKRCGSSSNSSSSSSGSSYSGGSSSGGGAGSSF